MRFSKRCELRALEVLLSGARTDCTKGYQPENKGAVQLDK